MKIIFGLLVCSVCLLVINWAHEKEKDDFAKKVADELEKRHKDDK